MKFKRLLGFIFFLIMILDLPNPTVANPVEVGERPKFATQGPVNDIAETVLERFLEAGQLIWIQLKQLIDPADNGFTSALQMHWANLKGNPVVMGSVGFALVGIPILIFRSLQTRKRHQQELQEIKDTMEDETGNYNYEEAFRKIHGSEEIEETTSELSQEGTFKKSSLDSIEDIAKIPDQESDETVKQLGQQFSILEGEFQEADSFLEKQSRKEESTVASPSIKDSESVVGSLSDNHSGDPFDAASLDDELPEKLESATKHSLASTPSSDEEMDYELSSLQEEMERTIEKISEQLVEDEEILPSISDETSQNSPSIEETYQELTTETKTFSSPDSGKPDDEVSESPSVKEILKWAEGESIHSGELETPKFEFLDLPENAPQESRSGEATKDEIDDEFAQIGESLSRESDGYSFETVAPDGAEEIVKDELTASPIGTEIPNEPEPKVQEFVEPEMPQPIESQAPPSVEKIPSQTRIPVPPERSKNYVNRLEQFQKRLENRIKTLENDLPILTPYERSLEFREKPLQKKPVLQDLSDIPIHWEYEDNKRATKKAYSLDILESFLLLERQKD